MPTDSPAADAVARTTAAPLLAVGFDIGGTNLRAAVVDERGRVLTRVQRSSDGSEAAIEAGIGSISTELVAEYPQVCAIGVAVAGFLDSQRRTVRFAPHLPWRDADLVKRLGSTLPRPLQLEHDANSAAWGEYRFGAARGADNWVLFALGTGIGGAMMHGGQLYRGAFGTAPEFGHLTVVPEGRPCSCGKRGCLERYCSGTALVTTVAELAATSAFADSSLLAPLHQGTLTGTAVMAAAQAGDNLAVNALAQFSAWLGQGLSIVGDVFDPELIVIGGGVSEAAESFLEAATSEFAARITGAGHRPVAQIRIAQLGPDAGMIGVADIARQHALQQATNVPFFGEST